LWSGRSTDSDSGPFGLYAPSGAPRGQTAKGGHPFGCTLGVHLGCAPLVCPEVGRDRAAGEERGRPRGVFPETHRDDVREAGPNPVGTPQGVAGERFVAAGHRSEATAEIARGVAAL